MTGTITLILDFWVEELNGSEEMAASLTLTDTDFAFNALVQNMNVTLNLTKINIDSLTINSDTFGYLNAFTVKVELNNFFRIAMPSLNRYLRARLIELPSNILGVFELSDLTLGYYDDYIYAGATPTFISPSGEFTQETI